MIALLDRVKTVRTTLTDSDELLNVPLAEQTEQLKELQRVIEAKR